MKEQKVEINWNKIISEEKQYLADRFCMSQENINYSVDEMYQSIEFYHDSLLGYHVSFKISMQNLLNLYFTRKGADIKCV